MKYLLILACLFLAGCDDLPKSGGNTGAYWYMKGWRSFDPPLTPHQILVVENGELKWRDLTSEEVKQIEATGFVHQPTHKEMVEDESWREVFYSPMAFPMELRFSLD